MFYANSPTAQSPVLRSRRRSLLRRSGVPDSSDILARYVRWERVRFYFLNRRRHVKLAASICVAVDVLDALESRSEDLPLATKASGSDTMTDMDMDLLHVGSRFV